MEFLLTTLVPALLPVAADAARGIIARMTGSAGAGPQNVAETIQLMQANTARVMAMAKLDASYGNTSLWVANLRASSRYVATWAAIAQWPIVLTLSPQHADTSAQFASSAFFFLFGDRVYLHLKKG